MAVLLMAGSEPPGSARSSHHSEQTRAGRQSPIPVPAHYGIYRSSRYCSARFCCPTEVVSECRIIVNLQLRLLHHRQHPVAFASYAQRLAVIFI